MAERQHRAHPAEEALGLGMVTTGYRPRCDAHDLEMASAGHCSHGCCEDFRCPVCDLLVRAAYPVGTVDLGTGSAKPINPPEPTT